MKMDEKDENYIYYVIGQNLKKLRKDKELLRKGIVGQEESI